MGVNSNDQNFKSTRDLIHYLVKAAGNNANFLLNIGPCPDGTIQPEFVERLHELGIWLRKNGQSIYETRSGPIKPMPWGVSTQKGDKIYLHILHWEKEPLLIPNIGNIVRASIWPKRSQVAMTQKDAGFVLHLSDDEIDEIDTIIELEISENLDRKL